jgi:signal peptidase I
MHSCNGLTRTAPVICRKQDEPSQTGKVDMIQKIKALFKSRIFWENLIIILVALIIYIGFRVTIQNYFVQGPSMEPNYWQNERIWVNKLEYKFGAPQTGDIIVFQPPIQSSKPFIKRIIGMPGETVEIKNGVVYAHKTDGTTIKMQEPYIKEPFYSNYNTLVIPANEYFVMGDNRNNSSDSRGGWFVSRDKIIGKAWLSIWPPHLWGLAPTYRQPAIAAAAGK